MGHSLHPQGFTSQGVQRVCSPSAKVMCAGPFRALSRLRGTQEGTVDRLGIALSARHHPEKGCSFQGSRPVSNMAEKDPFFYLRRGRGN